MFILAQVLAGFSGQNLALGERYITSPQTSATPYPLGKETIPEPSYRTSMSLFLALRSIVVLALLLPTTAIPERPLSAARTDFGSLGAVEGVGISPSQAVVHQDLPQAQAVAVQQQMIMLQLQTQQAQIQAAANAARASSNVAKSAS